MGFAGKRIAWTAQRVARMSNEEFGAFLEASAWLLFARILVATVRLPRIKSVLGRIVPVASCRLNSGNQLHFIELVSRAVSSSAVRLPGSFVCLPQAIAARLMLGVRGVHVEICVGMGKDEQGAVRGHAWTVCGEAVVTGERGREGCAVLMRF